MKTVVLVFHPRMLTSQINVRLARAAEELSESQDLTVRYMYDLYPDFRIDVEAEQAVLTEAERVILQFPVYWYSSPALLKQWQDDVLTYGWAYGSTGTALHGKELALAVSTGAPESNYDRQGPYFYTLTELLRPFQAMSRLVGMRLAPPFVTGGSVEIETAEIESQAKAYAAWLTSEHTELGDVE